MLPLAWPWPTPTMSQVSGALRPADGSKASLPAPLVSMRTMLADAMDATLLVPSWRNDAAERKAPCGADEALGRLVTLGAGFGLPPVVMVAPSPRVSWAASLMTIFGAVRVLAMVRLEALLSTKLPPAEKLLRVATVLPPVSATLPAAVPVNVPALIAPVPVRLPG